MHEKIVYINFVEATVKRTCTCNFTCTRDWNITTTTYQGCIYASFSESTFSSFSFFYIASRLMNGIWMTSIKDKGCRSVGGSLLLTYPVSIKHGHIFPRGTVYQLDGWRVNCHQLCIHGWDGILSKCGFCLCLFKLKSQRSFFFSKSIQSISFPLK